jgi:type IV pilus biogenesis protein PilP
MKNNRALIVLTAACCIAWPLWARAQSSAPATADTAPRVAVVPTPAAVAAADELMRLQEETVVLKAELKKLDAQADVAAREDAINRLGHRAIESNVSLIATQSLGKTMFASVATSDGGELDVRTGDTLPNNMRVVSIRPGAIVVEARDGHRSTLTVSSAPRMVEATGAGTANTGVPPIPTLPMSMR